MQDDTFNFLVYFEIYGKKMKTEVNAANKQQAIDIVKSNLVFRKIERIPKGNEENDNFDFTNILQELMRKGN